MSSHNTNQKTQTKCSTTLIALFSKKTDEQQQARCKSSPVNGCSCRELEDYGGKDLWNTDGF